MTEIKTPFTGDVRADALLTDNPLALMLGMLLDQQVPMEWAFGAPAVLEDRLAGPLDAATIAQMVPEALEEIFRAKPALHRYPGSMAKRTHALCTFLVDRYDGRAEAVWAGAATGDELLARVRELPGYGNDKARIFVGLLGKRLGVRPEGWEQAAADWPSIADVDTHERVLEIREQKRAMKAAKRAVQPAKMSTATKSSAKKSSATKTSATKSSATKTSAKKKAATPTAT